MPTNNKNRAKTIQKTWAPKKSLSNPSFPSYSWLIKTQQQVHPTNSKQQIYPTKSQHTHSLPWVIKTLNPNPKTTHPPFRVEASGREEWICLFFSLSLKSEMGFWFLQLGLSQNPPFQSDKFPYPWGNLFFVLWYVSFSLRSCVMLCVCCNMWTLSLLISYQVWIYFF